MASNNYFIAHGRMLTLMGLCIDPSDDPPLNPNTNSSALGNSLRSYILNANGAWLYDEYAMMGDPQSVATDYGIPGNGAGLGLASGGLPPEGLLYGDSFSFLLGQLLALQTAGFNNVAYSGPQIHLMTSPVWDRYVAGFYASLTPTPMTPQSAPWLGPVYQFAGYGDMLRLYVTPQFMQSFALLALLQQNLGKTNNLDAARWFGVNVINGGSSTLLTRVSNPWTWGPIQAILYYLLLDPTASYGSDPRPAMPKLFVDQPAGRILAHSSWGPNDTIFDYRASWISINHQLGDGGEFGLFRKGEWLTKEMCSYDNNCLGCATTYNNSLGLKNWCPKGSPTQNNFEQGIWNLGGQWMLGLNGGDPTTVTSSGTGYVYASSDLTNLYNRPDVWDSTMAATDITQANRSILWLNNDNIVVYDRATSIHTGLFKTFNLSLAMPPVINGSVATETMPDGQSLFIQTLLPANPSTTWFNGAATLSSVSELEPMRFVMTVQDAALPTDTRFLHVLQGADAGVAMVPATRVISSSGTSFDGALFGSTAVYFPVAWKSTVATTTFPLPAGVQTVIVTGLTPGGSYGVSSQASANGGVVVTLVPGGTGYTADAAGLVKASF